jgi:hypothetical protein
MGILRDEAGLCTLDHSPERKDSLLAPEADQAPLNSPPPSIIFTTIWAITS